MMDTSYYLKWMIISLSLRNSPKMIRRPTDQNRRPCLLLCPEGVATGSRPAERPPTLKQQVRDTQIWHKHTLIERETMRPPLPITHLTIHKGGNNGFFLCVCVCVRQETIWSMNRIQCCSSRRSSSSWETSSPQNRVSPSGLHGSQKMDSLLLRHPRESERWRGEQICAAVGR